LQGTTQMQPNIVIVATNLRMAVLLQADSRSA